MNKSFFPMKVLLSCHQEMNSKSWAQRREFLILLLNATVWFVDKIFLKNLNNYFSWLVLASDLLSSSFWTHTNNDYYTRQLIIFVTYFKFLNPNSQRQQGWLFSSINVSLKRFCILKEWLFFLPKFATFWSPVIISQQP